MPFKRKSRVLFISHTSVLARAATDYANHEGGRWLEAACAVANGQGGSAVAGDGKVGDTPCLGLNYARGLELDLVVSLDEQARLVCAAWALNARHRHYPLMADDTDRLAQLAEIRRVVDGILGGLKMLEKSGYEE